MRTGARTGPATAPFGPWALAGLAAIAILLRLVPLLKPHVYYPDEIFQYLEPAHHLVFGPAVIPWEYRYGMRNWLFPLLLAGPMWLGGLVAPASGAYLLFPHLLLIGLSLAIPWSAWMLGQRQDVLTGTLASLVTATWCEFIFFSSASLTETVAIAAILPGAVLTARRRWLPIAGLLLALGVVLRFQFGPAVAMLVLHETIKDHRDSRRALLSALAAGAAAVLVTTAMVDRVMDDRPFAWLFENVHQNFILGRSSQWGISGPFFYIDAIWKVWGFWAPAILVLAAIGRHHAPALFTAALANLVVHSLIGHKEYRFILLTTSVLLILAALGTADIVRRAAGLDGAKRLRLAGIAAAGWICASVSTAASAQVYSWWTAESPILAAFLQLRDDRAVCGVALDDVWWSATGGYTYLHRDVPIFWQGKPSLHAPHAETGAFNAVIAPPIWSGPAGYVRTACFDAVPYSPAICIFRRPGRCRRTSSPSEINQMLVRIDQ